MKSRKEYISQIVEQTLLEQQGFFSGVRMGAFPRYGDEIPGKLSVSGLASQERGLKKILVSTTSSPFLQAAAAEE